MKKQIRIQLADGRLYGIDALDVIKDKYPNDDSDMNSMLACDPALEEHLMNEMNWWEMSPTLISHDLDKLEDCEITEIETRRIL